MHLPKNDMKTLVRESMCQKLVEQLSSRLLHAKHQSTLDQVNCGTEVSIDWLRHAWSAKTTDQVTGICYSGWGAGHQMVSEKHHGM